MLLKQIPEDFIVEEIFSLEKLKERDENRPKPYYYFLLTKKNYAQIRAIEKVADIFNTSKKLVHFAGTKDKNAITKQLISVYGINEKTYASNFEYFNKLKDLNLEYLGKFKGRINLGDNLGNKFKIIIRDLTEEEIDQAKKNLPQIKNSGVLNLFDSQRFGYAKNSHIIGLYLLKNQIEKAAYEILTSLPENPQQNLSQFANHIKTNWEKIKQQDQNTIEQAKNLAPKYLKNEILILNHLSKHKNDFPGALRKIHKKTRTLYISAYQSYLFNQTIEELEKKQELPDELPLITKETTLSPQIKQITQNLLKKDGITFADFALPSMPELEPIPAQRKTTIKPENLQITKEEKDELNENKKKLEIQFSLPSGAYATNAIKQLFAKN